MIRFLSPFQTAFNTEVEKLCSLEADGKAEKTTAMASGERETLLHRLEGLVMEGAKRELY